MFATEDSKVQKPREQTIHEDLGQLEERLMSLLSRFSNMADRVMGPAPAADSELPNLKHENMRDRVHHANVILNCLESVVIRLESAI